jgi:DNA-binding MarR family transcriptional regulator
MCANVRRASRVLSQIYEDAMRPHGLRMTQFSILQALSMMGEGLQGQVADVLALDSTTLTRSVALLRKRGWVKVRKGDDQRERWLSLSKAGGAELARILPAWNAVQAEVRRKLGEERWKALTQLSMDVLDLPAGPAEGWKHA